MAKLLKILTTTGLFSGFSLLLPTLTLAAQTGLGFDNDLDANELVRNLLNIAIGVSGGIAFLLLVYGGFRMVASQGDPKALQDARGIITSAISGLLFIIFAVFILKLLGITILGLF